MAQAHLKKPIDTLLSKKNELDNKNISLNDQYQRFAAELQSLRTDQNGYRTASESMSNTVSNRAAKKVFSDQIAQLQLRVNEVSKELERVSKDKEVILSQINAIQKSIKELQNS